MTICLKAAAFGAVALSFASAAWADQLFVEASKTIRSELCTCKPCFVPGKKVQAGACPKRMMGVSNVCTFS